MTEGRRSAAAPRPRATRPGPDRRPSRRRGDRILGLDGLRAVAIIAVLVFHLRPATLPGGYLGVDVFFVVSGFLITTLLVRELRAHGRLDLIGFWTRRARRLLPALVVVVVVATVLGLVAGDDLLVDLRRQVLGALTFSNNWLEIAAGSSYFTHTAPQLFVNFWSLAVEEQFYLLWPILLAVLMALTRTARARVGLVLGVAAGSAGLMALLLTGGVTRVYYGTDTHVFGLMIGAALALALAQGTKASRTLGAWTRWRVPAAGLATAGLLVLLLTLDGEAAFAYRGGILLASLLTAVLVAALATAPSPADPLVRLASTRPLRWLGERSYGIYLWHWPLLLVVTAMLPAALPDSGWSWAGRGLALVLTIVASAVSYRLIETPIRRDGFRATAARVRRAIEPPPAVTGPRVVAAVGAVMVTLFGVALVVAPEQSQVEQQMEAAADTVASAAPTAEQPRPGESVAAAVIGSGRLPTGDQISAFGDSMLYVASPALQAEYPGIALDAESNRQWPAVVDAIEAAVEAGTVRDVVVIVAGTNAGLREEAPLREALDLLGPDRLVVLVNIYHSSSWVPESNATMARVAEEYPNAVVADWAGTVTQHLDQLQPDGVHPDMDGMYLFADVVTAAFVTATGADPDAAQATEGTESTEGT